MLQDKKEKKHKRHKERGDIFDPYGTLSCLLYLWASALPLSTSARHALQMCPLPDQPCTLHNWQLHKLIMVPDLEYVLTNHVCLSVSKGKLRHWLCRAGSIKSNIADMVYAKSEAARQAL